MLTGTPFVRKIWRATRSAMKGRFKSWWLSYQGLCGWTLPTAIWRCEMSVSFRPRLAVLPLFRLELAFYAQLFVNSGGAECPPCCCVAALPFRASGLCSTVLGEKYGEVHGCGGCRPHQLGAAELGVCCSTEAARQGGVRLACSVVLIAQQIAPPGRLVKPRFSII